MGPEGLSLTPSVSFCAYKGLSSGSLRRIRENRGLWLRFNRQAVLGVRSLGHGRDFYSRMW